MTTCFHGFDSATCTFCYHEAAHTRRVVAPNALPRTWQAEAMGGALDAAAVDRRMVANLERQVAQLLAERDDWKCRYDILHAKRGRLADQLRRVGTAVTGVRRIRDLASGHIRALLTCVIDLFSNCLDDASDL